MVRSLEESSHVDKLLQIQLRLHLDLRVETFSSRDRSPLITNDGVSNRLASIYSSTSG